MYALTLNTLVDLTPESNLINLIYHHHFLLLLLTHIHFPVLVFSRLPDHSDTHGSLHPHRALNLRRGPGLCGKFEGQHQRRRPQK